MFMCVRRLKAGAGYIKRERERERGGEAGKIFIYEGQRAKNDVVFKQCISL